MLGDELVGRNPEKSQTLPHLAIIGSSGLADKHVCRLPHCQRAVGRVRETLSRVSVNELLESRLAWENETCESTDFFAHGKDGVWKGSVSKLPNGILVLSKSETDKDCTFRWNSSSSWCQASGADWAGKNRWSCVLPWERPHVAGREGLGRPPVRHRDC